MYFADYTVWTETVKDFLSDYLQCCFVYVGLKINMTNVLPHAEEQIHIA
jgi:hypothetical protein